MCFQGTYCKITALEEGDWWRKKEKVFWECGWWNHRKAEIYSTKEKHTTTAKSACPLAALCTRLFVNVVKMWTDSRPGRDPLLFLATDATAAGYGKHRRGGGALGQVQRTNRLVRPDSKTVQIWMCGSKEQEGVSGIKLDFYCVTRENICKLLTGPRHQGKTNLQAVWDFRTLTMLTHTNIKYSIRT